MAFAILMPRKSHTANKHCNSAAFRISMSIMRIFGILISNVPDECCVGGLANQSMQSNKCDCFCKTKQKKKI